MGAVTLRPGFPEDQRETIAALFWEAFADKLGAVLRPDDKARAFIANGLQADFAISAVDSGGRVLGVAGFKTTRGGLLTGGFPEMTAVYGRAGALWRAPILGLTERRIGPGQLLMDGLFVGRQARGKGVGTALVGAIIDEAATRGLSSVRLDVVDTNPRAAALYARLGFRAVAQERLGPLALLFGFSRTTTMVREVRPAIGRPPAEA